MKNDKDLYITVLEYAVENVNKGIKFDELYEYLISKGFNYDKNKKINDYDDLISLSLYIFDVNPYETHGEIGIRVTPGAYFNYLEYIELQEARSFSKKSMIVAIISIGIAFLTLATSIYFSTHSSASSSACFNMFSVASFC